MKTVTNILAFLIDNWEFISPVIVAILLRIWPTKKDMDLINKLIWLIDKLIPNRKKGGGHFINKAKIIVFICLVLPVVSNAQLNGNFKSVRFVNVSDSTTVIPVNGTIYYNEQSTKFRVYENGTWKDLIDTSGGAVWGNISGTISNQTDLQNALDGKWNVAGTTTLDDTDNITVTVPDNVAGRTLNLTTASFTGFYGVGSGGVGGTSGWIQLGSFDPTFATGVYLTADIDNVLTGGAGAYWTDTRGTPRGVQYAADYSAGFDDRSIIDRGFGDGRYFGEQGGNFIIPSPNDLDINFNQGHTATNITFDSNSGSNDIRLEMTSTNFRMLKKLTASANYTEITGPGFLQDANATTGATEFLIDAINHTVTDNTSGGGLRYSADYSANFVDRSLVDKAYTDNNFWSSNSNTTINTSGGQVFYQSDANNGYVLLSGAGTAGLTISESGNITFGDDLGLYSFVFNNATGLSYSDVSGTTTGIVYGGDYSAGYTARSLVDKAYVDANAGQSNTASNLGTGEGVFASKVGDDLRFKSLTVDSENLSVASNATEINFRTLIDMDTVNLGGWDMVANSGHTVNITDAIPAITSLTNVLHYSVFIIQDDQEFKYFYNGTQSGGCAGVADTSSSSLDNDGPAGDIQISFTRGCAFNGLAFDDDTVNRGYVFITYFNPPPP